MSLVKLYKVNKVIGGELRFVTQGNCNFDIAGDLSKFFIHPTSHIKSGTYIECSGGVNIGSHFHCGRGLTIFSKNHNWRSEKYLPYDELDVFKPVVIGRAVWVGSNVTILPGVIIGDGAVVAAGSVVISNVMPGKVVGGNPAVEIAHRNVGVFNKLLKNEDFF